MGSNPVFSLLDISAGGMHVQRRIMDVVAENIANARTLRDENGGPYRRRVAVVGSERQTFRTLVREYGRKLDMVRTEPGHVAAGAWTGHGEKAIRTARVDEIRRVESGRINYVYDPYHPEADEQGYVAYPDINVLTEMVEMMTATRAYEANMTAFNSAKELLRMSLNL